MLDRCKGVSDVCVHVCISENVNDECIYIYVCVL
jgi:hypothetical protein